MRKGQQAGLSCKLSCSVPSSKKTSSVTKDFRQPFYHPHATFLLFPLSISFSFYFFTDVPCYQCCSTYCPSSICCAAVLLLVLLLFLLQLLCNQAKTHPEHREHLFFSFSNVYVYVCVSVCMCVCTIVQDEYSKASIQVTILG